MRKIRRWRSAGANPGAIMCANWGAKISPNHDQDRQKPAHEGHHGRENPPAFVLAAFGGILGEDGNECGAQGGSGHEIVQEIGQGEGRVIHIGHRVRADLVRHGPLAKESEQPAGQDAAHHNARGGENAAMNAGFTHSGNGRGFGGVRLERSSARESKLHW